MAERFRDQVYFITGASSGIGEALARRLASEGAKLALLARREDRISKIAAELGAANAIAIRCDVTQDGDLEKAVQQTVAKFGRIDGVVANAGFSVVNRLDKLKIEDFRRQIETNVFGVLRTIYATLEEVKKTKGRIALLGSVMGHVSLPECAPYAMSKYAVRGLAESIREELIPQGVSVTLISPGFVTSEIRHVDNSGQLQVDRPDYVPSWIQVSAEDAAKEIASAIYRRKRERVITFHGKVIVSFARYFPGLFELVKRHIEI